MEPVINLLPHETYPRANGQSCVRQWNRNSILKLVSHDLAYRLRQMNAKMAIKFCRGLPIEFS